MILGEKRIFDERRRALSRLRLPWPTFPLGCGIVVNNVGLASLDMNVHRCIADLVSGWHPDIEHAAGVFQELRRLALQCDHALPAIPEEGREYFLRLRDLIAAALAIAAELRPEILVRAAIRCDDPTPA